MKDKSKQPSQHAGSAHYPGQVKPGSDHQKGYMDQFNQHQQQLSRSFQEQAAAMAARGQDTKRMQHTQQQQQQPTPEDMFRMSQYGSSGTGQQLQNKQQLGQDKLTHQQQADKVKSRQGSQDFNSDLRQQRAYNEQRIQAEMKKMAEGGSAPTTGFEQTQYPDQGINRDYSMLQQQQQGMYPDNNKDNHMQQPQQTNQQQSYSCQKQNKAKSDEERRTSPHHKPRPGSPRIEKQQQQGLASCRMDQQQQQHSAGDQQRYNQNQVYGVPSATPAENLPGFKPSIQHSREQKNQRQSLDGQQFLPPAPGDLHTSSNSNNNSNSAKPEDKKDRDTPASVAGSDGSHNSAPVGIPNELLDFVTETAMIPVFKPQDSSKGTQPEVKVSTSSNNNASSSSPAKQPGSQHSQTQASPPKSAPVIPERDTSALEELVKHIDASPSPRADNYRSDAKQSSTDLPPLSSPLLSPPTKSTPTTEDKGKQSPQKTPSTCQLLYSTIPGLMGTGSQSQSDKDNSEAEKSDYDFDHHDKGGVDYDDDFEDDLPLGERKRSQDTFVKQSLDISSWTKDSNATTDVAKPKEVAKRVKKVPCYKKEEKPSVEVEKPAKVEKPEVLTKRGTKMPCYKEKDPDFDLSSLKKVVPVAPKGKGGKGGKSSVGGKLFSRKNALKYDPKAIEKVHKNLAGTDFDFGDEFDDAPSFSQKEEGPGSLRDFRQLAKVKKTESSDFDEELSSVAQMPPVLADEEEPEAESPPPPPPTSKTKPSGRGRKPRAARPQALKDDDSDIEVETKKVAPLKIKAIKKADPPKVPKLKIKLGSAGSIPDESTTTTTSSRKSSITSLDDKAIVGNDETEEKVPPKAPITLKIRLGKRDDDTSSDKSKESFVGKVDAFEDDLCPPPLTIRRTPKSSPKKPTPRPYDDPDFDDTPPPKQDFSLESLKSDLVKSSPRALAKNRSPAAKPSPPSAESVAPAAAVASSATPPDTPTKKPVKGSIDKIANKLVAKQQSSVDKDSELNAIFGGPCEPLTMNLAAASEMIAEAADKDDGPSELDLLAMELKKFEKGKEDEKLIDDEGSNKDSAAGAKDEKNDVGGGGVDDDHPNNIMMKKYKMKSNAADFSRNTTSPGLQTTPVKLNISSLAAASSSDKGHHRMRKKELLNSYIHGLEPPVQPSQAQHHPQPAPISNGPVTTQHQHAPPPEPPKEPIRTFIKMPKAVASITSVPTRADYQPQLEANMERKRKREGKEEPKGKGQKKGKGKQAKTEEEQYKPKFKKTQEAALVDARDQKERRTRGMPPKKCLQESPEREDPRDSYKNSYLKFGEEMLKQFDQEEKVVKKSKKRKKEDENHVQEGASIKTPRIVIKFSKAKEPVQRPVPGGPPGSIPGHHQESDSTPHNLNKIKIKELKQRETPQC